MVQQLLSANKPTHMQTTRKAHTTTQTHTQTHTHRHTQTRKHTDRHTRPNPKYNEQLSRQYHHQHPPVFLLTLRCAGVVHHLLGLDTFALSSSTPKITGGCRCTYPSIHFLCACTLNTRKLAHMPDFSQQHAGTDGHRRTKTADTQTQLNKFKSSNVAAPPLGTQDMHDEKTKIAKTNQQNRTVFCFFVVFSSFFVKLKYFARRKARNV